MNNALNSTEKKKVLIVEDDAAIRLTIAEIIESEGYSVELAVNGQEALDHLKNKLKDSLPNLILLDLMMPVKDGLAFRTEQLASPDIAHLPVVLISANGNMRERLAKMSGEIPTLKKPFELDQIISTVKKYCS